MKLVAILGFCLAFSAQARTVIGLMEKIPYHSASSFGIIIDIDQSLKPYSMVSFTINDSFPCQINNIQLSQLGAEGNPPILSASIGNGPGSYKFQSNFQTINEVKLSFYCEPGTSKKNRSGYYINFSEVAYQ